jgi:hypothetical protein
MLRQLGYIITTMLQRVNVSKNPKENNVNRISVYVRDNITILNLVSPAIEFRSPKGAKQFFPLASASRAALGSTQPPVQWVPGVLPPGPKRGRGVTLTTYPHIVSAEVKNE